MYVLVVLPLRFSKIKNGKIMEELVNLFKCILEEELKLLKKYHIDQLGYRYFLPDGRSFGWATGIDWYEKPREKEFYKHMEEYLYKELVYLHQNNYSYVTRSSDHEENEYLKMLKEYKLDNSVGIYKFSKKRIDSIFFIYESNFGEQRDFLLNNMKWLEKHANSISKKMDAIFDRVSKVQNVELRISPDKCKQIFNSGRLGKGGETKYTTIIINGVSIVLSKREKDILKILASGESNKYIASELGLNEKTIEKHMHMLKDKFKVSSKNNLITLANSPQLQAIL